MQDTGHQALSEIFSTALDRNASSLAIEDSTGNWSLTYEALSERACAAGDWIQLSNAKTMVLCLEKTIDFYVLEVACFSRGFDFCPIDPINPIHRIAAIVKQLPEPIVICDRHDLAMKLKSFDIAVVEYGKPCEAYYKPSTSPKTDAPRYYIATSGSTGVPKIVMVPFSGVVDFLRWSVPHYQVDRGTRWAQFSSVGFDLSIVDLLTVLIGGGTLVPIASNVHRVRPSLAIKDARITHWHSVPSIISYIIRDSKVERFPIQFFSFCGEPLHSIDAEALLDAYPTASIVNTYGPTEGTLFCSYYEYKRSSINNNTVPIGRPIPGWDFIWEQDDDKFLRLIIASNNIAIGYLSQDSEIFSSAEIFGRNRKLLDTGDFFFQIGGEYFFSHRKDSMAKVSGNRLDLGEVEAAAKNVGFNSPVCVTDGNRIYMATEGKYNKDGEHLLDKLKKLLPKYAIPAKVLYVPQHFRTPNGKIDRSRILNEAKNQNV